LESSGFAQVVTNSGLVVGEVLQYDYLVLLASIGGRDHLLGGAELCESARTKHVGRLRHGSSIAVIDLGNRRILLNVNHRHRWSSLPPHSSEDTLEELFVEVRHRLEAVQL